LIFPTSRAGKTRVTKLWSVKNNIQAVQSLSSLFVLQANISVNLTSKHRKSIRIREEYSQPVELLEKKIAKNRQLSVEKGFSST
jgi:hypothetical protein